MNAPAFFPQIVTRHRKPGDFVAIAHHEVGGLLNQIDPERANVFDVAISEIMPPERPDDECGFIFLNRQGAIALEHPRVPTGSRRAIGVVFVQEVSVFGQNVFAEGVEPSGDVGEAGHVQGVGDEGAIARPHVGIGIAGELHDVAVVGGDDRPAVVDLGTADQQAALEEIDDFRREIAEVDVGATHPQPPVAGGSVDDALRGGLHQPLMLLDQFFAGMAGDDDHVDGFFAFARHIDVVGDGAVHRTLRDGVAL